MSSKLQRYKFALERIRDTPNLSADDARDIARIALLKNQRGFSHVGGEPNDDDGADGVFGGNYTVDGVTLNNAVALLAEVHANGNINVWQLFSWFQDNAELLKATQSDLEEIIEAGTDEELEAERN